MTSPSLLQRRGFRRRSTSSGDAPESVSPEEILLAAIVRNVLAENPGLAELASAPSAITVIGVPSLEWAGPFRDAWVRAVHGRDAEADIADDFGVDPDLDCHAFCRVDAVRARDRDDMRGTMAKALHSGKPIYGISQDPEHMLPNEMLRLAERFVTVPPLAPAVLADALAVLTGEPPRMPIPEDLAEACRPSDLALAWQPGLTADVVLARLKLLVVIAPPMKRSDARLENLFGMDEARDWGLSLARDVPEYVAGLIGWEHLDRGILLAGPPGCGKTTFALRLANTCDLPLIIASPQRWQGSRDGHLGHALGAMQQSFRDARAAAPCILFLDELDGMGSRETYVDHNRDYCTAYINGLLEELDGLSGRAGVIVVGACNNPSRLDPALVRSGRLDRIVNITLPDVTALAGILRQQLGHELPDADLTGAAELARGSTGADCEKWVRGARRRARHASRPVELEDLLAELSSGLKEISPVRLRRTAVHEAGHGVVAWLTNPGSVVLLRIGGTGNITGTAHYSDDGEAMTRVVLERTIRRLMAGRAAEDVVLGTVSAGAGGSETSDLAKATYLASSGLLSWGLGSAQDGSNLLWRPNSSLDEFSSLLAQQPAAMEEVKAMLAKGYAEARSLLAANRALLIRVADALAQAGSLDTAALARLMADRETSGKDADLPHDIDGQPESLLVPATISR